MKIKSLFLCTLASLSLTLVNPTPSFGIEITPSTFVYQLDSLGLTQDVVFYNRKDKPERVKISFKPYKTDAQDKYLGKWATIYPKITSINPDSQKTVKFSIEPPPNLNRGEYRALLFMEELEQKALDNIEGKVTLKNGNTTQINMLINLGVLVYGYVGDPSTLKISGKVTNPTTTKSSVSFNLKNDGEITKPYKLVFSGKDLKTKEDKIISENIVVVQGYEEFITKDIPKDINVLSIVLIDSNEKVLNKFK